MSIFECVVRFVSDPSSSSTCYQRQHIVFLAVVGTAFFCARVEITFAYGILWSLSLSILEIWPFVAKRTPNSSKVKASQMSKMHKNDQTNAVYMFSHVGHPCALPWLQCVCRYTASIRQALLEIARRGFSCCCKPRFQQSSFGSSFAPYLPQLGIEDVILDLLQARYGWGTCKKTTRK